MAENTSPATSLIFNKHEINEASTTTDTTSTGKQEVEITPVSSSESAKKTKEPSSSSTQKLTADGCGSSGLPLQYV